MEEERVSRVVALMGKGPSSTRTLSSGEAAAAGTAAALTREADAARRERRVLVGSILMEA